MKKEIRYRLNQLEIIIHDLHHNMELLTYLSVNLHRDTFNSSNNLGLYWIWQQILNIQVVTFYKVMIKDEKFSFAKIINIAKDLKVDVNIKSLEKATTILKAHYDKTDLERVRSKYIAHQDLNVPKIRADLLTIIDLTDHVMAVFFLFSKEFKGRKVTFSDKVTASLGEIFNTIDEYEYVKAFLIAERINGNEIVKIAKISQVIRDYQKEVKKALPKR